MPAAPSLGRKEKHQWPPRAQPPVELVVLAGPRFLPFVPTQPGCSQFRFSQQLQINKMLQVSSFLPANTPQFGGNFISALPPIIATGVIHRAAIEVNPDWLRLTA